MSNRHRFIKVFQIGQIRFRTVFLDRFTHGQFFKRLTEIKLLLAVRHHGAAQHILRQRTEQAFGQLDQIFVIRISHIEFHHGELWVMTWRNTFVAEVTVDLEHAIESAHHQTLQIKLWSDTQIHVDIQRIVMGDERTRRRAARDHLHHRGFHFHKVAAHHELANAGHDLRTNSEGVTRLLVGDEIKVTLTVARFLIGQAVELVRQRTQCFGQQAQFRTVNRQFAGFGFEQFAARAQDIAEIPLFELLVVDAFSQIVTRDVKLNPATHILQGHERGFTHDTTGHHTSGNADFDAEIFKLFVALLAIALMQLV